LLEHERSNSSNGERSIDVRTRYAYATDCNVSEWLALKPTTFKTARCFPLSLVQSNSRCVTWTATMLLHPTMRLFILSNPVHVRDTVFRYTNFLRVFYNFLRIN